MPAAHVVGTPQPHTGRGMLPRCTSQNTPRVCAAQVDRAKVNEQFFSEIRNPQLSVFDVIGRYLDNHGALI